MAGNSVPKPKPKRCEMKKVLITGGPVHAHLDAVKVITNRFQGGLMCKLAEDLMIHHDVEVTYLFAPSVGAKKPKPHERIRVIEHAGFTDYQEKIVSLSPEMDAVVLGAAVANLVPANPWKGKFPSHDYKPGDIVNIPFMVSPRIIDMVKKVAPRTHLFGYKLLSNVTNEELIRAAYSIVLEAKATAVFANDTSNLKQKYAVTKERGVHPLGIDEIPFWIYTLLNDNYYKSVEKNIGDAPEHVYAKLRSLIQEYKDEFFLTEAGLIFGTIAVRHCKGFLTTGRGKRELDSFSLVDYVDHSNLIVHVKDGTKASLNAPLLANTFMNPLVDHIVHYHKELPNLPTFPYAPPGSRRDSIRPNTTSFNIKEHGCMLLFNKDGVQL